MIAKLRDRWGLLRHFSAEFVVIIVGVLIALAINEWWGSVEESNLADVYVRQLIADTRATEEMFSELTWDENRSNEAALSLLAIFEKNQQADLQKVRNHLYLATGSYYSVPVLGTAEALVSTGDLRLIPDPYVRAQITEYISFVRDYWLVPVYGYEEHHRNLYARIESVAAENSIAPRGIGRPREIGGLLRTESRDSENADVQGFISNNEAYAALLGLVRMNDMFRRYRKAIVNKTSELRVMLEESVEPN